MLWFSHTGINNSLTKKLRSYGIMESFASVYLILSFFGRPIGIIKCNTSDEMMEVTQVTPNDSWSRVDELSEDSIQLSYV